MEDNMGEAREVLDRMSEALLGRERDAIAACYAEDAVVVSPDSGEIRGRDAIARYHMQFVDAFSNLSYEYVQKHESGNAAIDEGHFIGTNDGPITTPSGETIPATGGQVRVRTCDIATVQNGQILVHQLYFDQLEFLSQLGLMPSGTTTATT
jgi:ketosteroid isomerase-like protein